jgi:hypothetical protein
LLDILKFILSINNNQLVVLIKIIKIFNIFCSNKLAWFSIRGLEIYL